MMPRHARRIRGAYTLMEMLIVIIIMITLVSITLPIAKKTMEDAGPKEASRQLLAMFSLARAKAANSGLPWGIWIECEPPLGGAPSPGWPAATTNAVRYATKFYLAEVPPLYAGDFLSSRATVNINSPAGPWPIVWSAPGMTSTSNGFNPAVATLYTMLTGLPAGANANQKTEFHIRFNADGPFFRGYVGPDITGITGNSPAAPYVFYVYGKAGADRVQLNGTLNGTEAWGQANFDDDGSNGPDDPAEYLAAASDDVRPPFPQTNNFTGTPFQILRQPERVGNVLELSSGTCIDLAYSGMGPGGVEFSGYRPGYDLVNPGISTSQYGSIVVMFLPGGGVESIYRKPSPGVTLTSGNFGQIPASGTLHFLIGKVEKINFPAGPNPYDTTPGYKYLLNMFDPEKSNLADPGSLWLSIGRYNGAITTTENVPPALLNTSQPTLSFQNLSPTGQQLSPPQITIDVSQAAYLSGATYGRPKYLGLCRTIAAGQQQMGGR